MAQVLRVVVMGVCGCGKSTVGQALATRLGLPFVEGDSLHPAHNVAKMASGVPLDDDDRQGWLEALAAVLAGPGAAAGIVVSCSALRRRYRDILRAAAPDLRLVHLHGDPVLLAQRLVGRRDHYMPPALLQSQLDTLEAPGAEEHAMSLDIAEPAEVLVERLVRAMKVTR